MSDLREGLEKPAPCPFCGAIAEHNENGEWQLTHDSDCYLKNSYHFVLFVRDKIIKRWNRRALLAAGTEGPRLREAFHAGWAKCHELSGKVIFPETPWYEADKYLAALAARPAPSASTEGPGLREAVEKHIVKWYTRTGKRIITHDGFEHGDDVECDICAALAVRAMWDAALRGEVAHE